MVYGMAPVFLWDLRGLLVFDEGEDLGSQGEYKLFFDQTTVAFQSERVPNLRPLNSNGARKTLNGEEVPARVTKALALSCMALLFDKQERCGSTRGKHPASSL